MRVRVGISQRLEWLESRVEMRQTLDAAWCDCLAGVGALPLPLPVRGIAPERMLRDYGIQVLLLTGGNEARDAVAGPASRARNMLEAGLLRAAQADGVPVLAVCHGLQLMNVSLGGALSVIEGHVRTMHAQRGPLAQRLGATHVNSFHDVGIRQDELAGTLRAVGTAPDGSVEAAVHCELSWLGVMWHPERAMPPGVAGTAVLAEFLRDPAGLCGELRREPAA